MPEQSLDERLPIHDIIDNITLATNVTDFKKLKQDLQKALKSSICFSPDSIKLLHNAQAYLSNFDEENSSGNKVRLIILICMLRPHITFETLIEDNPVRLKNEKGELITEMSVNEYLSNCVRAFYFEVKSALENPVKNELPQDSIAKNVEVLTDIAKTAFFCVKNYLSPPLAPPSSKNSIKLSH